MKPIRLMIVDDHELVRIGVKAVADEVDDMELVGDYGNAEAALGVVERLKPDVVLMGVDMRGMDGIHACRHILSMLSDTRVIILTSHTDEETVFAAIVAGASGYLLKNISVDALLQAVRIVAGGGSLLDPTVTQVAMDRLRRIATHGEMRATDASPDGVARLSPRESEVFALIVDGCTNKDIAARLVISENTVRNHVSHVLHKLGLHNRGEAVVLGWHHC